MDRVLDNLYIGTQWDVMSATFGSDWRLLCVLESVPPGINLPNLVNIPVYDPEHNRAVIDGLDRASDLILRWLSEGRKVVVFCAQGIERSPLTVAYHLSKTRGITIQEAYGIIKKARPFVADRSGWLVDARKHVPGDHIF